MYPKHVKEARAILLTELQTVYQAIDTVIESNPNDWMLQSSLSGRIVVRLDNYFESITGFRAFEISGGVE